MKSTIQFDLPDEQNEFFTAVHAADWYSCVWGLDDQCRTWLKYGHKFGTPDDAIEAMREYITSRLDAFGISLEMID